MGVKFVYLLDKVLVYCIFIYWNRLIKYFLVWSIFNLVVGKIMNVFFICMFLVDICIFLYFVMLYMCMLVICVLVENGFVLFGIIYLFFNVIFIYW